MIILASASPRRRKLLKTVVDDFQIITADIDEEKSYKLPPLEAVLDIAKRKGEKIKASHPNDVIISADTIVVFNNEIIGKPTDEENAKEILHKLSGKKHEVITAYCIFKNEQILEKYVISAVFFHKLDEKMIDSYVASGSPLDKAGAYGVQDNKKFPIVEKVIGSITNVIGFPIEEIKKDLKNILKA